MTTQIKKGSLEEALIEILARTSLSLKIACTEVPDNLPDIIKHHLKNGAEVSILTTYSHSIHSSLELRDAFIRKQLPQHYQVTIKYIPELAQNFIISDSKEVYIGFLGGNSTKKGSFFTSTTDTTMIKELLKEFDQLSTTDLSWGPPEGSGYDHNRIQFPPSSYFKEQPSPLIPGAGDIIHESLQAVENSDKYIGRRHYLDSNELYERLNKDHWNILYDLGHNCKVDIPERGEVKCFFRGLVRYAIDFGVFPPRFEMMIDVGDFSWVKQLQTGMTLYHEDPIYIHDKGKQITEQFHIEALTWFTRYSEFPVIGNWDIESHYLAHFASLSKRGDRFRVVTYYHKRMLYLLLNIGYTAHVKNIDFSYARVLEIDSEPIEDISPQKVSEILRYKKVSVLLTLEYSSGVRTTQHFYFSKEIDSLDFGFWSTRNGNPIIVAANEFADQERIILSEEGAPNNVHVLGANTLSRSLC